MTPDGDGADGSRWAVPPGPPAPAGGEVRPGPDAGAWPSPGGAGAPPPPGGTGAPPPPGGWQGAPPPPSPGSPGGHPPPGYPTVGAGYGYPAGYGWGPPRTTNSNATVSLVLGLVGMLMCGLFAGIPALVVGSKARKEIRASNGTQEGDGMALAGMILGGLGTAWSVLVGAFYVVIIALAIFAGSTTESRFESVGTEIDPGPYQDCDDFDEWSYNDC